MASTVPSIVIGMVTAAAFGMAVRDTVTHGKFLTATEQQAADLAAQEATDLARLRAGEAADAAAQAKQAADTAALVKSAQALLPTLVGAKIGPGPAFETAERLDAVVTALHLESTYQRDGVRPDGTVRVPGDSAGSQSMCAILQSALDARAATWGRAYTDGSRTTWADPVTHHRVAFVQWYGACELQLDASLGPQDWLDQVTPAGIVGRPAAALRTLLAARASVQDLDDSEEASWSWTDDGLGTGTGRTHLDVRIQTGRVTALHAYVDSGEIDATHLDEALIARFGKPVDDGDGGESWNKPVTRSFYVDGGLVTYSVGE